VRRGAWAGAFRPDFDVSFAHRTALHIGHTSTQGGEITLGTGEDAGERGHDSDDEKDTSEACSQFKDAGSRSR
jgi:hypothetical protein